LGRRSLIPFFWAQEIRPMMGERRVMQEALFYGFSLERHVPDDHLLRKIDRFIDLSEVRAHLGPYYSEVGRPSIDPELMIRMFIVGYCFGIRSERRLCEEVHLNLAYRWFCRLGLDGRVPDHSTFSKNRHGRFRESDPHHRRPVARHRRNLPPLQSTRMPKLLRRRQLWFHMMIRRSRSAKGRIDPFGTRPCNGRYLRTPVLPEPSYARFPPN
jgi:transposase